MKRENALHVIVNREIPHKIKSALQTQKIEIFDTCKANILNRSLGLHPDIQIHFLANDIAVCAPEFYEYYQKILPSNIYLHRGDKSLTVTYPGDCAYNIARLGNYAIGNIHTMSSVLKDMYHALGVSLLHVNQGYAKCNICIVNSHALITEDKGIYSCVSGIGEIDCLYLKPGEISLDGFSHGFIGGASGNTEDCLYFCGSLNKLSQREEIRAFLKKHHINIIELCDSPLKDYGSLLFF